MKLLRHRNAIKTIRTIAQTYSLPLLATTVFLVVGAGLGIIRHVQLSDVPSDLQNVKVSTSSNVELISQDEAADFERKHSNLKISEPNSNPPSSSNNSNTDAGQRNSSSTNNDSGSNTTSTTTTDNTQDTSNTDGGQNADSEDGSGGGNGGDGSQDEPESEFKAEIVGITHTEKLESSNSDGCTIQYRFESVVKARNGPGEITYFWEGRLGSSPSQNFDKKTLNAEDGDNSYKITFKRKLSTHNDAEIDGWARLHLTQPDKDTSPKETFTHTCPGS